MEWIKAIIEKHTKEDGTVDIEAANAEIKTEFPKNAVPKADFNAKVEELKTANDTLSTLKDENKDVEALQTTIAEHEGTIKALQDKQAATAKQVAIEKALTSAKATDVEYLTYKLGEVELGEDGTIKDIDSKIKDLQTNHPTFFQETEPNEEGTQPPAGFKLVENGLKDGKQSEPDLVSEFTDAFTADIPVPPTK